MRASSPILFLQCRSHRDPGAQRVRRVLRQRLPYLYECWPGLTLNEGRLLEACTTDFVTHLRTMNQLLKARWMCELLTPAGSGAASNVRYGSGQPPAVVISFVFRHSWMSALACDGSSASGSETSEPRRAPPLPPPPPPPKLPCPPKLFPFAKELAGEALMF